MNTAELINLPLDKKRELVERLKRNGPPSPAPKQNGKTHVSLKPANAGSETRPPRKADPKPLKFSLLFFSEESQGSTNDPYRLVRECAKFGDENGFNAIWVPERHFHPFGAIYPNPAVLCAHLAGLTKHIRLRAGSVVLPLEDPIRVVEAWAMIDHLSGGRVDVSFASGWNPNDFVLSPDTFKEHKRVLSQRVEEVRRLWRGESIQRNNGRNEACEIRTYPRPCQPELPVWFTAATNPATFAEAGRLGCNVLTMLFSSSLEELGPKIGEYRRQRLASQHFDDGTVTLMLHTFLSSTLDQVQAKVREPFLRYIRSSIDVQKQGQSAQWDEAQLDRMAGFAYERYFRTGALFGTPSGCEPILEKACEAGVNEIACQLDFGVDADSVLENLVHLKALKERHELSAAPTRIVNPGWETPEADSRSPASLGRAQEDIIAIVGMSGRFPGADNPEALWENLMAGRDAISDWPASRCSGAALPQFRGAFLKDIEGFDASFFGISEREAALMDPHQRLFLETAWTVLEDARYAPAELAGQRIGVFAAMYSPEYGQRVGAHVAAVDSEHLLGRLSVMVANRVSHLLDLRGPSEVIDTACSSSLVAIHRAILSIRSGECDAAIAGGVSLLLSPVSTEWLGSVEMLSPDGVCRPFDKDANGLVRGEGVGAVLLKPLRRAITDGDHIYAVVRASGVSHNGRREGALATPSLSGQSELLVDTYRRSEVDPATIRYIEAHGAASKTGDFIEFTAFRRTFKRLAAALPARSCGIGTIKSSIGALDAAGGIAGVIKMLLALKHSAWPAMLHHRSAADDLDLQGSPFYFTTETETWSPSPANERPHPRRGAVHAFGLGGANAHLVLEEFIGPLKGSSGKQRRAPLPPRSFSRKHYPLPHSRSQTRTGHPYNDRMRIADSAVEVLSRLTISDPFFADHRVGDRPLLSASMMCELARAGAEAAHGTPVRRLDQIAFLQPCEAGASGVEVVSAIHSGVNSWRFEIHSRSVSGETLHAEGTAVGGVAISGEAECLPLETIQTRCTKAIEAADFYRRFAHRGIGYGPRFQTAREIRHTDNEAIAKIALPAGFDAETSDFVFHPTLLDTLFQLASAFVGDDSGAIRLPFVIGRIESLAPLLPICYAYLRKSTESGWNGVSRFDGWLTESSGRILLRVSDLCLKELATDETPNLESVLERVAAGTLSVDDADRLLSQSNSRVTFDAVAKQLASDLSSRYPTAALDFLLRTEGKTPSVRIRTSDGQHHMEVSSGDVSLPRVTLSRANLERLMAGAADPTVLFLQGLIRLKPDHAHALKQKIGGLWFEKFNSKQLHPRFQPLHAGQIYRLGEVASATGVRREVFPWTISAEAGRFLYEMVQQEKAVRTLEVGMAYGLSTLFIAQAHLDRGEGEHVVIDPCQQAEFLSIGLDNVRRAGLERIVHFMGEPDYVALPKLLGTAPFQFIFIDGLHMFDYTLLDFFYCDRLLAENGVLVFDDCLAPGVARAIDFVRRNRTYTSLDVPCGRLACFRKTAEDARSLEDPNFHRDF